MNRKIPALIASWIAIGSIVIGIPNGVSGASNTNVTLSLQSDPTAADVSFRSSGLLTISGNVSCIVNGSEDVRVYLESGSEFGIATINPSNFYFEGDNHTLNTRTFGITTRVPQGYPSNEPINIFVSGSFIEGNHTYPIPDLIHSLEIQPYYDFEVKAPPPQEIGAGEFVYFAINITNIGNSEDTYEFLFDNLRDLCGEMWTVATITPKSLEPGRIKTFVVSAQAPQTWTIYRNKVQPFNLRILSQKSIQEGVEVKCFISLLVRQRGSYIPGFTPSFAVFGIIFVSLVLGKKKLMVGKGKPPEHPKDLYSELSMSIR
jgi:hypothetical protein